MTRSDLAAAFDDGPALVSYVVAGDPTPAATAEYIDALVDGGTDVIELGLPFSEPVAEGTTIQNAIKRALDADMTPDAYLDLVARIDADVPVVCMTYYNLLFQYGDRAGPAAFVSAAAEAGVSGFVVPDLPVDESGPLREACRAHGLDLVFVVAPTTTADRRERMLDLTTGFVYVQGRVGTTGAREEVSAATPDALAALQHTDIPKAVGFGVSSGEQAREITASGADGVIVGSAYVDTVADGVADDDPPSVVADRLRDLAAELKAGAARGVPEPEHK
ncbi:MULTISPECIES: tryptophan synthase subunit alpha [Halobacterium]|uniref:tryptophan synthase subunit alpha n=1 Tax=Halobacterium TaxID=2239 RepID=UPI001966905B|nr:MULTISPECIES: tryptophan synthase subunit alpha [Halobacterium]MDL0121497.1 tryptophan synthase subunit alpha [Halobacterium salinarum]MDL0133062.1 tryptophan synthase subunit alpha [Halobacterium salinarum]QRY25034.1 tryptophan synthase subunit alpha [Halobacterium sp. BOL4-2]